MPFYKYISVFINTRWSQSYKSMSYLIHFIIFIASLPNKASNMEKEEHTHNLFPKFDYGKGKEKLINSESAQIMTNYYGMEIKKSFKTIYQYSIGFEPELPADASKVVEKIIDSIRRELKTKLGFICYKGRMLWGNVDNGLALITSTTIEVKGEKQSYEIILKPAPVSLTIEDFIAKD